MKSLAVLNEALDYIEAHLKSELSQTSIAAHCCCSLSSLQKLFRYAFHISVGDYVTRRRLTCCARELVTGNSAILDLALTYGYQSAEAFTRAFTRMWGEPPAAFRKKGRFPDLFPKLERQNGGNEMSDFRRKYDVSELYDLLSSQKGAYMLAFDIQGLVPINEISSKAGDIAIRESMRRIDEAAGENMLLFRIGGDEFALVTGLRDEAAVDALAQQVLRRNGETFSWEERQIPLSLYAAKMKIPDRTLRYNELYPEIIQSLDSVKK